MPLPPNFSPWEHLQSVLISVHNKRVREEFADASDDDLTTPRSSLKLACTLRDTDSAIQTLLRMFLFYMSLQGAEALHPPLYTMPVDRYQQQVKFSPQVTLYFKEDLEDVEQGYAPLDAEISFRLTNETGQTLTQAELRTLANKIKAEFSPTSAGYRWRKGRVKVNYRDPDRGYLLSLNAFSESQGREVIAKVLSIQGHTIDPSKLSISQLAEAPPVVPPMQTVLGKQRRQPRRRPVGWVRFVYAELHVWGDPNAVCLVDRSRRRRKALLVA